MEEKRARFCKADKGEYIEEVSSIVKNLLISVGEDPEREGLKDTPKGVAKTYREIFKGYCDEELPNVTVFNNDENYNEMILDEGYYYSFCEHHIVPFFGKVFIAYIPDKKLIGISKLARVVDHFAARLQVQERLTKQIAEFLNEVLKPKGVAVLMQGRHLCRELRGVKKLNAIVTTTELIGAFKEDAKTRAEFMGLVRRGLNNNH
ncbi:MAG: GTP cyclohydrolase I FolE [Nanoarchaeota archaeon]